MLLPFLPEIEPATFLARVRRSVTELHARPESLQKRVACVFG